MITNKHKKRVVSRILRRRSILLNNFFLYFITQPYIFKKRQILHEMSIVVFLYSKYSNQSLELLKTMEGVLDFRKLCIDNEEIRMSLLSPDNKNYVKEVPAIFVIHSNGNTEKHEGALAFDWVRRTLDSMKRLSEDFLRPDPQQQPIEVVKTPIQINSKPFLEQPTTAAVTASEPVKAPEDTVRRMDSSPIMDRPEKTMPEENDERQFREVKKEKNVSIQNLAASLQAEREKEDEKIHPNPISKIKEN